MTEVNVKREVLSTSSFGLILRFLERLINQKNEILIVTWHSRFRDKSVFQIFR